jgi:endonuclease/exonuclease/phosphatase family metal-dependent hydrolase
MTAAHRTTWRVVTWNVRGSAGPDLARLADVIAGYAPDLVAVQEIQRRQVRRLGALLDWRYCWTRKHFPFSPLLWWTAEGLAILTPHSLGGIWRQTISPGVSTWTFRHRVLLAATVSRRGNQIRVYDTHLAAGRAPNERIAQARRVAQRVAADDAQLRIVAGDLNAAGEPEVIREFHPVGLSDPGGDATHPSAAPRRRLDYVLVPEGARVVDRSVPHGGGEWTELSDHLPLVIEFDAPLDPSG